MLNMICLSLALPFKALAQDKLRTEALPQWQNCVNRGVSVPRLIALLLALVTLAVYLPVTGHAFINYDDPDYVSHNFMVQRGWTLSGLVWAFTTFQAGNWHPLTWLSHMTDCALFGLNPGGHHFVNVLLHAGNASLLFLWLWRLTQKLAPAAVVAALFAWHPAHVESVAWVAERKDVLSTCFALLTLLSYLSFTQTGRRRHWWLALVWFALGLMAKPMLVTLPFVLLLLDFWPLQRLKMAPFNWRPVVEKLPFFALSAASCFITMHAQRAGYAVVSFAVLPFHYRLENAVVAVAGYLLKLFWPANLAVIYPFALSSTMAIAWASAILLAITGVAWWQRKSAPYLLIGWLWFLGTLVPVTGLVQVGGAIMADRYTYLPSIGIFMAVAFWLFDRLPVKIFQALTVLPLIACVILTEKQLAYWRNSETLFRHAVAVTDNNLMAHVNLGSALADDNRPAEALAEFQVAAPLAPFDYAIFQAAGDALLKLDRPQDALSQFSLWLAQAPNSPEAHAAAGRAQAALGNTAAAADEFATAIRLNPFYAEPHLEQAKLYFQQGADKQADDELRAAVRAQPEDVQTLVSVAYCLAASTNAAVRDGQSALDLAFKANELSAGRQAAVYDVLGMAFAATGDFTNAAAAAENALELTPSAKAEAAGAIQQRLRLYREGKPWSESLSPGTWQNIIVE